MKPAGIAVGRRVQVRPGYDIPPLVRPRPTGVHPGTRCTSKCPYENRSEKTASLIFFRFVDDPRALAQLYFCRGPQRYRRIKRRACHDEVARPRDDLLPADIEPRGMC